MHCPLLARIVTADRPKGERAALFPRAVLLRQVVCLWRGIVITSVGNLQKQF